MYFCLSDCKLNRCPHYYIQGLRNPAETSLSLAKVYLFPNRHSIPALSRPIKHAFIGQSHEHTINIPAAAFAGVKRVKISTSERSLAFYVQKIEEKPSRSFLPENKRRDLREERSK